MFFFAKLLEAEITFRHSSPPFVSLHTHSNVLQSSSMSYLYVHRHISFELHNRSYSMLCRQATHCARKTAGISLPLSSNLQDAIVTCGSLSLNYRANTHVLNVLGTIENHLQNLLYRYPLHCWRCSDSYRNNKYKTLQCLSLIHI